MIYILKTPSNNAPNEMKRNAYRVKYCCRLRLCNPHKIRTSTIFVQYVCYNL